jgi:hypothetical protein
MRLPVLLIGLLVACVFLRTLSTPLDYDLWFDLRMGREIASTGTIPHQETFLASSSLFEAPHWLNDEWGFAWASWQIYQHFGLPGLAVAKALLLALLALVLCLGCRLAGLAPWATVLLVALELWMVQGRFMLRPHLVSDLLLALQTWLVLRQERSERVFLPALMFCIYAFWTNVHAGLAAGLAVLGAIWVGSRFRRLYFYALVAAALGAMVRPGGWEIYVYVHKTFARKAMMENNIEWLPIPLESWLGPPGLFVLVMLGGFVVAWKQGRFRPGHLIACLGMLFTASRHGRALGEFGAATTGLVAYAWGPSVPDRKSLNLVVLIALLGVLLLGPGEGDWNRRDIPRRVYPEGALEFLRAHQVPGTVFNSYHLGGYLVFREAPVMIHGMTSTFPDSLMHDYLDALQDPVRQEEVARKYSIGAYLLHYTDPSEAHSWLAGRLARDPRWSLVYFDDVAVLYVPSSLGLPAYRAVNPALADPFPRGTLAARSEVEAKLGDDPGSPLTWWLMGQLEGREKRWQPALEAYTRALELDRNDFGAYLGRGQARLGLGDAGGALSDLKQAVALRPDSAVAHYNLAVVYLNLNKPTDARREAEKAARLRFEPAQRLLERL